MNNFQVDSRQVINLFSELTSRQQKQVHKTALRRAAGLLSREAKQQLKKEIGKAIGHKNRWNNKTLGSGIKTKVNKEGDEAKVHILGDFRLRFFELGTKVRKTKKGYDRGIMKATYFFKTAKQNKEREIFNTLDQLISQSIQKIANKNK